MRRSFRFRALAPFFFAASALTLAYGCGGATNEDDGDGDDAAVTPTPTSTPTGTPTSPPGYDGGLPGDGSTQTFDDAGSDADVEDAGEDAEADAEVDAGVDSGPVDPPGPLFPGYVDYDVNHVLVTGQSNAVATGQGVRLSTTQPYTNLMFNTGLMSSRTCDGNGCKGYASTAAHGCSTAQLNAGMTYCAGGAAPAPASFIPLIQNVNFWGSGVTETVTSGLANLASQLATTRYEFGTRDGYPTKHDILASVHGRSGNTYSCLRKSYCNYNAARGHISPFAQGTREVADGKRIAEAGNLTYAVRAVVAVHGESDHYSYVSGGGNHPEFPTRGTDGVANKIKDYKDALIEWQQDYEAMAQGITGQAQPVPLFLNAVSGWTTTRTSQLVQMQIDAHIAAPGKVIYVTPAYPFRVLGDCNHFSAVGERHLGEYFGKVYAKVVLGGETWEPVRPRSITRGAGAQSKVITVQYHVPSPPLVFDTTRVAAATNRGFDVVDNGTIVTIQSVAITGPSTVTITLQNEPSGGALRLRYAQNQATPGCIGPGLDYSGGARGNLRDSDNTPSHYGYDLFNWGANFDFPVD